MTGHLESGNWEASEIVQLCRCGNCCNGNCCYGNSVVMVTVVMVILLSW